MKKHLILFVSLCMISLVQAQVTYDERIEIEVKNGYTANDIRSFGDKGVVLTSSKDLIEDGLRDWKYELYDKDLRYKTEQVIRIPKRMFLDEEFTDKDNSYTLFKDKRGRFTLVSVNAENLKVERVNGTLPKKCWVKEMAILGNYAYFKSTIRGKAYLFSINRLTGAQKIIPIAIEGVNPRFITLENFQLIEKTNEVILYVQVKQEKKKADTYIITIDENGQKKKTINLTKNIDENIIDISTENVGQGEYIFTGTYSTSSLYSSEGIFFCKTVNGNVKDIHFTKFLDLENFLSYLPEKRQEKIEKKKQRKESRGKDYTLNYRMATHDLIQRKDGYILIGEAYYATYRTIQQTTYTMVNGVSVPTTQTITVFDGYQYTHAFVAKYSLTGELLWDQTFKMWPTYKPFTVKRFISVAQKDENSVKMVYACIGRIFSKEIDNNGKIISEFETDEIATSFAGDDTKRSFSNIDYWYGNSFLAYGIQKIKNKEDKSVKRKRWVYFVSKVRFE